MTDNEKNRKIHEWLGNCYHTLIPSGKVTMSGFEVMRCSQCNKHESFCEPCPDYLHDNGAAVGLLDVLVGKDVYWFMRAYQKDKTMVELRDIHGNPLIPFQSEPSISEAISEAILALIEKEATNG